MTIEVILLNSENKLFKISFLQQKNIVRGGHFSSHSQKKFLVINGHALFTFINIIDKEKVFNQGIC